jgi:predicted MPP superfamily phosphohydrolase
LLWQNNSIVITKSEFTSPKVPKEFDEYVIAQISDLHNKKFGIKQAKLLDNLRSTSPDVILVTGDLIDSKRFDINTAMDFIKGAIKIAPIYYVSGNHEAWSNQYSTVKSALTSAGVKVLDNSLAEITKGTNTINLLGLIDPSFSSDKLELYQKLEQWSSSDRLQILLSHRPELFELYANNYIDLVFSGHAHGGQFRIPFIGGLVAPDQGFLPKYTSGRYDKNNTVMYVSRGLGNSIIPIRIFNRPEIVVVKLKSQE